VWRSGLNWPGWLRVGSTGDGSQLSVSVKHDNNLVSWATVRFTRTLWSRLLVITVHHLFRSEIDRSFKHYRRPSSSYSSSLLPVGQSVSQSASQPVSQPASQSVSQSVSRPVSQPVSQSVSQPSIQPASQSVSPSIAALFSNVLHASFSFFKTRFVIEHLYSIVCIMYRQMNNRSTIYCTVLYYWLWAPWRWHSSVETFRGSVM
jgi:hypothetical protein